MLLWTIFLFVGVTISTAKDCDEANFLTDEFIDFINRNQSLWIAGRNFDKDVSLSYIRHLAGTLPDNITNGDIDFDDPPQFDENTALPENFDARLHWTKCPIISDIRDQGTCGSCWAVAPATVLTDRICISTNGAENFYFSEHDILTCCLNCGKGCSGGGLGRAWNYSLKHGVVSGGKYLSSEGCKPYEIAPCDHRPTNELKPCVNQQLTPSCVQSCEKGYKKSYESDKIKSRIIYELKNEKNAMLEIFKNGPLTTSFKVYSDFLHYKSGIYRHVSGCFENNHSVKLLGWGVQDGVKYWLAANSWNTLWGDKGVFKILRGENHCGIESHFIAGAVQLKDE